MSIRTNFIHLEQVSSTNDYAAELIKSRRANHLMSIRTDFQSAGKGQKGSSWESEKGKNLLVTIILLPEKLEAARAFYISTVTALAITDPFLPEIPELHIKWPNDIYFRFRKLGGILIENTIGDNKVFSSLVGIGLNINQTNFPAQLPNPVSLALITGKEWQIDFVFRQIYESFVSRFSMLEKGMLSELMQDYHSRLLGYNKVLHYKTADRCFDARLISVLESGEIVLEHSDGTREKYGFKEVSLLEPGL